MANKFVAIVNGVLTELVGLVTSTGAGDANKLVSTGSDGKLDASLMPTGIGADVATVLASEALSNGDQVNVYNNGGTPNVRKANATDATKPANGFVLANVSSGSNATVYFRGANTGVTGLTAGVTYCLSAATGGAIVALASAPAATGNILQVVGVATSATSLEQSIDLSPITRA